MGDTIYEQGVVQGRGGGGSTKGGDVQVGVKPR